LNPGDTRKTVDIEKYRGSSLRYYIKGGEPGYLYTKEILGYFKGNRTAYAKFVHEGLDKENKPPILKQAYMGDDAFSQRIRKQLGYINKAGSRSHRAKAKQEQMLQDQEEKVAQKIIDYLALYFEIPSALIKKSKRVRGNLGKARTIAVVLLRKYLPWTCLQITGYLGLKGKSDINPYLQKAMKGGDLKHIEENLKDILNDTHVGV
jgi:hypothetical protein